MGRWKQGVLVVPQILPKKVRLQANFLSREGKWEGQKVIDGCRHLT